MGAVEDPVEDRAEDAAEDAALACGASLESFGESAETKELLGRLPAVLGDRAALEGALERFRGARGPEEGRGAAQAVQVSFLAVPDTGARERWRAVGLLADLRQEGAGGPPLGGSSPSPVPSLSWDHSKEHFLRDSCVDGAVGAGEARTGCSGRGPGWLCGCGAPTQSLSCRQLPWLCQDCAGWRRISDRRTVGCLVISLGSPSLDGPLPLSITDNFQMTP